MNIDQIIRAIRTGKVRITDHADEEAHNDRLPYEEIFTSVINGEIIEEYPEDKPYPSCLIYGSNFKNEPIHSVWGYNKKSEAVVLITVYRPTTDRWIDWKTRRKKQ